MIFVTVGSQKFPFDRLLIKIDQLKKDGSIQEEVFAQIGHSTYQPQHYSYVRFMDQACFEEKLEQCDLLITHGGTGVIITALKLGKKVLAVPRLAKYHEHVDDHQLELLKQFNEQNLICCCQEMDLMEKLLSTIRIRKFQPFTSNTAAYLKELDHELASIQQNSKKNLLYQRINKYFEYIATKLMLLTKQKCFQIKNEKIHYMFKKKNSNVLIIVFSSCTRRGVKARYNYVRTLKGIDCDQLFILDDWGYDQRGIYYLGREMNFSVEQAVEAFIEQKIQEAAYEKIIFAGSSKGGYAALNFGLRVPGSTIIAGAPQYRLGEYFTDPANKLEETLRYIAGNNIDQSKLDVLNTHLEKKINKYAAHSDSITIHLHYSEKEHTYGEHISGLIEELRQNDFHVTKDIQQYSNHSDISLYFPQFLLQKIDE